MGGRIIVIDGMDGCGKATQTYIIKNKLIDMGYKIRSLEFPAYDSLSSGPVRMYLNGEITDNAEDLNPYICSSFYAVDRGIQYYKDFKSYYDDGYTFIADRYISANIIYQGAKFSNIEDKHKLFKWIYEYETKLIGIPVEDITIALTLPIMTSQKLMSIRYNGDDSHKDLHESDIKFLNKSHENLDIACEYLPTIGYNWVRVDCSDENGDIKDKDEITNDLMKIILPIMKDASKV